MPKSKHKAVKFTAEEMAYELPAEVDVKKMRRVGTGTETVKRLAERSRRTIGLDPDVARVFPDSEAVNAVSRAIIASVPAIRPSPAK